MNNIAKNEIARLHARGENKLSLSSATITSTPVAFEWVALVAHQIVRSSVAIMAASAESAFDAVPHVFLIGLLRAVVSARLARREPSKTVLCSKHHALGVAFLSRHSLCSGLLVGVVQDQYRSVGVPCLYRCLWRVSHNSGETMRSEQ